MDFNTWISLILGILGMGLGLVTVLMRIIYSSLQNRIDKLEANIDNRLRTLTHEDRDIRNQIQGVTKLFFQAYREKE